MPEPFENPLLKTEVQNSESTSDGALLHAGVIPVAELEAGLAVAYESPAPVSISNFPRVILSEGSMVGGRYKLIELVGAGGMGTVWRAEQLIPVKRQVAVKLIKAGMDSSAMLARFQAERQALALMDHPNIAKVLDAGITDYGHPFFVMELVSGTAITTFCDQQRLPLVERLRLFIPVCHAIFHAHQKGIIHRDIKPSNVMVALYDGVPVPKVIDFGVAKASGTVLTERSLHTVVGTVMGTPEYMSPEQAELKNMDIDTRSDVYSLGALVYELLTGSPPFRRNELEEKGIHEVLRVIREVEPPRPSDRLSTSKMRASISAARNAQPQTLGKLLRNDLDWVVLKSLEKDRDRRYQSAVELAADLERYLRKEPVEACPPNAAYRARKLFQRHRTGMLSAAAVLLALMVGISLTTWGMFRAESARALAVEAEHRASQLAEREKAAKEDALRHQALAEQAEEAALESFRQSVDDAITRLIGSKPSLGPHERDYLDQVLQRWRAFADRSGDETRTRAIRAEAYFRMALICETLGQFDQASAHFRRSLEDWDDVLALFPDHSDYLFEAAHCQRDFALLLCSQSQLSEADILLKKSFEQIGQLVENHPDRLDFRQEYVRNLETQSRLRSEMGDLSEAVRLLQKALPIQEKLVRDQPDVAQYLLSLATCNHSLASRLSRLGKQEAEDHYRRAVTLFESLCVRDSGVLMHRRGLGACQKGLGHFLVNTGKNAEAEALLRKALHTITELGTDFPSIPEFQAQCASAHEALAWLLRDRLSRTREAEAEFRKSMEILEQLAYRLPDESTWQTNLGDCYGKTSYVLAAQDQLEEAIELQQKSIHIFESLVARYPQVTGHARKLGLGYGELADRLRESEDFQASLGWYQKAIEVLLAQRPATEDPAWRNHLRFCYQGLAKAKMKLGLDSQTEWNHVRELLPAIESPRQEYERHLVTLESGDLEEGLEGMTQLLDREHAATWDQVDWYNFACAFAEGGRRLPARKEEMANRAMELLAQSIDSGFMDAAHIRRNDVFDWLRDRDDFRKLLLRIDSGKSSMEKGDDPK